MRALNRRNQLVGWFRQFALAAIKVMCNLERANRCVTQFDVDRLMMHHLIKNGSISQTHTPLMFEDAWQRPGVDLCNCMNQIPFLPTNCLFSC
jgi:hypothetical protein